MSDSVSSDEEMYGVVEVSDTCSKVHEKYKHLLEEFPDDGYLRSLVEGLIEHEESFENRREALKGIKKNVFKEINSFRAGVRRSERADNATITFVTPTGQVKELRNRHGKPLSYQCQTLITMFTKEYSPGTEITVSMKELKKRLENWPCEGDKINGFNYFRFKHLKPMGIIK